MTQNRVIEILEEQRAVAAQELDLLLEQVKERKSLIAELDISIAKLSGDPDVIARVERRSGKITLQDMVLQLVKTRAEGSTAKQIADQLTADGRETGNTTVSSVLSRLKTNGLVEKRENRWFTKTKEPPEGGSYESEIEEDAGTQEGPQKPTPTGSNPVSSTSGVGQLKDSTSLASAPNFTFPGIPEKGG